MIPIVALVHMNSPKRDNGNIKKLSRSATTILSIPASSATSGRSLSETGKILWGRRQQLSSESFVFFHVILDECFIVVVYLCNYKMFIFLMK